MEEWGVELEKVTFALCAALECQGIVYLGQMLWKGDAYPGQVHREKKRWKGYKKN